MYRTYVYVYMCPLLMWVKKPDKEVSEKCPKKNFVLNVFW